MVCNLSLSRNLNLMQLHILWGFVDLVDRISLIRLNAECNFDSIAIPNTNRDCGFHSIIEYCLISLPK